MDNNFLSEFMNALFQLGLLVITGFVIPYVKNKVGTSKFEKTAQFVATAVKSAEQIYGSGEGQKKLQHAIDFLKSKGIKIDETVMNQIESAVFENTVKSNTANTTPEVETLHLNS